MGTGYMSTRACHEQTSFGSKQKKWLSNADYSEFLRKPERTADSDDVTDRSAESQLMSGEDTIRTQSDEGGINIFIN